MRDKIEKPNLNGEMLYLYIWKLQPKVVMSKFGWNIILIITELTRHFMKSFPFPLQSLFLFLSPLSSPFLWLEFFVLMTRQIKSYCQFPPNPFSQDVKMSYFPSLFISLRLSHTCFFFLPRLFRFVWFSGIKSFIFRLFFYYPHFYQKGFGHALRRSSGVCRYG